MSGLEGPSVVRLATLGRLIDGLRSARSVIERGEGMDAETRERRLRLLDAAIAKMEGRVGRIVDELSGEPSPEPPPGLRLRVVK